MCFYLNEPTDALLRSPLQLLAQVLSHFSTHDLLPLTRISHRLEAVTTRLLHHRHLAGANPTDYYVVLECYHPTCKATEPYLLCSYLGTQQLQTRQDGEEALSGLGQLGALYSRFRPFKQEFEPALTARRRYGTSVPIVNNAPRSPALYPAANVDNNNRLSGEGDDIPPPSSLTVMLDDFEPFFNMCVNSHLVGCSMFTTSFGLMDGVVRLWREWLAERARGGDNSTAAESTPLLRSDDSRLIWVDPKKDVGLKVHVVENRRETELPVLMHRDESMPAMYSLVIDGKCRYFTLLRRTGADDG